MATERDPSSDRLPEGVSYIDLVCDKLAHLVRGVGDSCLHHDTDSKGESVSTGAQAPDDASDDDASSTGKDPCGVDDRESPSPTAAADASPDGESQHRESTDDYVTLERFVAFLRMVPAHLCVSHGGLVRPAHMQFGLARLSAPAAYTQKVAQITDICVGPHTVIDAPGIGRFNAVALEEKKVQVGHLCRVLASLAESNPIAGVCVGFSMACLSATLTTDSLTLHAEGDPHLFFMDTTLNPLRGKVYAPLFGSDNGDDDDNDGGDDDDGSDKALDSGRSIEHALTYARMSATFGVSLQVVLSGLAHAIPQHDDVCIDLVHAGNSLIAFQEAVTSIGSAFDAAALVRVADIDGNFPPHVHMDQLVTGRADDGASEQNGATTKGNGSDASE